MALKWISIFLIIGLIAGCGNQSVISNPKEVEKLHKNQKTSITFWHTYNDKETDLLEQNIIPAFEKANPNIHVESINLASNSELKNILVAQTSSKRGPDVARLDVGLIAEFSNKELFEPLSELPDFKSIRQRFQPEAMETGYYKGDYYSIPLNLYTKAAIFNQELLKDAGYSTPPSTMDDVLKIARKHNYTIGLGGLDTWDTIPYIESLGGVISDEKFSKTSGYLNSERTIQAVEQLKSLNKEHVINIPEYSDVNLDQIENWDELMNGKMLMVDEGPWFYYNLQSEEELNRALKLTVPAPFPHNEGPANVIGGENLVMMKGTKHRLEAWTFLKWMTEKETQLTMTKSGLIPTNKEAVDTFTSMQDSYHFPYSETADQAFSWPPVKNWSKIEEVYTYYLSEIFKGKLSVKEGLDRAAAEIDKLLADSDSR
ncbi:extracellular solute-binding protein [Bacillus gobiensis]|uniref:extracellular solute-binding protein n=1 Tax=Bacillus gobiensis TaxID=1441095 RepID=UPI003D24CEC9